MNTFEHIETQLKQFLATTFDLPSSSINDCSLTINIDEKQQQFGDISTNAAMILAKTLKKAPRDIAQTIINAFQHPDIETITIAGPGFINITLTKDAWPTITRALYREKHDFFRAQHIASTDSINIEFVSANPTGPLHFGHGRGGIIGDVFGNIVRFLGYDTTKEYYINDAGSQIAKLGNSLKIRCLQLLGDDIHLPEDAYQGEYLKDLAAILIERHGDVVRQESDEFFQNYAKIQMLARIKDTLAHYGIHFDTWFSEKSLHDSDAIVRVLEKLDRTNNLYEKDGALYFKSTQYGDDKDRVIRKQNGELTYAAADIAYLQNKADRQFNRIVMVLGHDHHSYATRLHAMHQALGLDKTHTLEIILYQLVHLKQNDQAIQMSKRTGTMVTLHDIIDAVGTDVARFFYLHRKADAQLEFDIDLALKKTDENPVYYIQYAYVRCKSILEKAAEHTVFHDINEQDIAIHDSDAALLLKKLVTLKDLLHNITTHHQTHLLAYYAIELAQAFHRYYNRHRVIDETRPQESRSRLVLVHLVQQQFLLVFSLLGISAPERM